MEQEQRICVKNLRPGDTVPATRVSHVVQGYKSGKIVTVECSQGTVAQCLCGPRTGNGLADSTYLINSVSIFRDVCGACDRTLE